jgi:hypothetical protein
MIIVDKKKKDATDYFRTNILESLGAFTAWKMIYGSRSNGIVSTELAEQYINVQDLHPSFFVAAQYAFLFQFVIKVLHSFDRRDDSLSLYKVDKAATEEFVDKNIQVISALRNVRNKVFAHRDAVLDQDVLNSYTIPSMIGLNDFFKNLIEFYNLLTIKVDGSTTAFDLALDIKDDIDYLFMHLHAGEIIRKEERIINWKWLKDDKNNKGVI